MTSTDIVHDHSDKPRLTHGLMAKYGVPNMAIAIVGFPLATYLPTVYSTEHGIAFGTIGLMIFLSRLTDVFTDPAIGIWSDRTRGRWGRRKPFIIAGIPVFMFSLYFLFVPPEGDLSPIYVLVWIALLYFGYTLIELPYKSWGAELSGNYAERSRVTGWREGFGIGGLILALALPHLMRPFGLTTPSDWLMGLGVLTVILLPILFWPALKSIPEPEPEALKDVPKVKFYQGIRIAFANRAFLRTLIGLIALLIGGTMTATLGYPFVTVVMGQTPEFYTYFVLAYYAGSLGAVPIWMKIADNWGKHNAVAIAVGWLALWSAPIPFLEKDALILFMICMIMKGTTVTALFLLPPSIGADVVDQDTIDSGEQRTGLFFSLWGMIGKLAIAVGILLGTNIPAMYGFDPAAVNNSETAEFVLAFCYSLGPAIISIIAVVMFWNFPIDAKRQHEIREQIAARTATQTASQVVG